MISFSYALNFSKLDFFLKHRRVPLRKISVLWDKNFEKKSWYTPSSPTHKSFRYPIFSEAQKGCPTKFFGTVRHKLWQKSWYNPPSLIHKIFWYPKFSDLQTCSPTKFLDSVGQKIISIKKWYPLPLRKIFRNSIFFWNTEGFPFGKIRYCETEALTKNRDTTPSCLIHKVFRYPKFSETQACSPTKFSASVGQTKNSTKIDNPLLCVNFFETWFSSETQKGAPSNIFGTVRQKILQKIVIQLPLLLSITFFDTRSFLKHRRVPLRNVWTLWDKKSFAQKIDIPFLSVRFFDTRFLFETQKGSLSDIFGTVRQKLWQKIVLQIPLLLSITFSIPEFFWNTEGLPYVFFRYCETKILKKNRDTPPLLLSIKISDIRSFLKHRRVTLRNFSVLWDTNFDKNSWFSPVSLIHKTFR